ncbi:MAG: hypothetical protein QXE79_00555, partial [Candidatus Bathyarchaeia archaeon]
MRLKIEFDVDLDAQGLARFLEVHLPYKFRIGRGFITVDADLNPGRVRELLERFLYKSGYRDHRVILDRDNSTLRINRIRERSKGKGRRKGKSRGSYVPPPSSSLPYFFP